MMEATETVAVAPPHPQTREPISRGSFPVRHPQYRPGLFGFLRVPQII
jgi:hypothetical protein